MESLRFEQDADPTHRVRDVAVELPVEPGGAVAVVETQHQPHGRRLPSAVRAEEPGDDTRLNGEAEIVDGPAVAEPLAEPCRFDHTDSPVPARAAPVTRESRWLTFRRPGSRAIAAPAIYGRSQRV